jgi:phosphonate transport system permease protein
VNEANRISEHYGVHNATLRLRRVSATVAFAIALILFWRVAEIRPSALIEPGVAASVGAFIRGLFPPDLSIDFLSLVSAAAAQTLALAIAGTALSIVIGLPLALLATPTLWRRGVLLAGEPPGLGKLAMAALSRATRALLGFLRAVPDLMWALLFVVAVGLGPLAGALALAVSYGGVLGRVYADVFEDVNPGPIEALHATGATRYQVFLRAIWPQAAPSITAYTLYSFECCVRAASVLGFIGAGGIGYQINLSMRLFEYGEVLTLIATSIGLVAGTDALSRFLRRRLHANVPAGSLAHQHINNARSFRGRLAGLGGLSAFSISVGTLVLGWSFYATGFLSGAHSGAGARVLRFLQQMVPPDIESAFLASLGLPLIQTVSISVMGTLIGIAIGAVLSLPATSTLIFPADDAAGKRSLPQRLARNSVYTASRMLLNLLRSIPELVWVLVAILAVGVGPFAGTLAIGLHTGGVLGKLYAETLEEVPARPIEALRAGGARSLQILLWGVWPQARPMLVSYTVLRWEMNLRVSTILGLVGGGGLGQAIYNNVQLGFYQRVVTLVGLVYALVIATDWLGDRLRYRRSSI